MSIQLLIQITETSKRWFFSSNRLTTKESETLHFDGKIEIFLVKWQKWQNCQNSKCRFFSSKYSNYANTYFVNQNKYCSLTRKNILMILIHLIEISVNDRTFPIQSCFDIGKVERIAVNVMHRLYVHLCIVGKFVCQVWWLWWVIHLR